MSVWKHVVSCLQDISGDFPHLRSLSDNVVQRQGKVRMDILCNTDQTSMAWAHCLRKLHAPKYFGFGPPMAAVWPIFDFSAKLRKNSMICILASDKFIFWARTMISEYVVSKMIVFYQKMKDCNYLKNCKSFNKRVWKTHFWTSQVLGTSDFEKIKKFWNLQEQSFLIRVCKNCQKKFQMALIAVEGSGWSKFLKSKNL